MHKKLRIDYEKIARLLSVVVLLLTITVAILFGLLGEQAPTEAASDWYNQNWLYRQKISVDYTKVSNTDQTDFPVLLDLSDLSSGFFTNVQTDGGDIVVTAADGVTKLQRELVSINTGGSTGELWFKAPSLSSSTNTDFWIYYGNATANEGNSTAVWSNGYELVQHMNEDPSGSAPQLIDSTLNDNDGTSNGTMTTGDLVAGKIGYAIDFDGTDDYFSVTDDPFDFTSSFSVNTWAYYNQNTDHNMILGNLDYSGNTGWMYRTDRTSDTDGWAFFIGNTKYTATASTMATGTWINSTIVYDDTNDTVTFYKNGSANGQTTGVTINPIANTYNLEIAKEPTNSSFEMNGLLDEIKVSTNVLSADWIATEYNNQNDPGTFFSFNTQESFSVGWYNSSWAYRQQITINSSQVPNTDQVNFPVYIDLSDLGTTLFTFTKTDGTDILVTTADGTSKISRELVSIDISGGTGELWFKAPVISSTEDTIFYIYYGNSSASEINDTDTWSNGYAMVQHMNEDPSTSAPQIIDSTANSIDGTSNGTMTTGDLIPAQVSSGISFDGSDDYIALGNPAGLQITGDQVIEMWLYPTSFSARRNPYAKAYGGEGTITQETDGKLNYFYGTNGGNSTPYQGFNSITSVTLNQWNHVAVIRDLTNMTLSWYINGVNTYNEAASYSSATAGSNNATIAAGYVSNYSGIIDEVRISNTVKTGDWIITEYNNQSDPSTFYSVSGAEIDGATCPVTDGGAGDGDSTINGIITISANTTWTADRAYSGVINCGTLDIVVQSGVTLTLASDEDGDEDYNDGDTGVYLVTKNLTVEGIVSANSYGYPGGNGGHLNGYGPGAGTSNGTASENTGSGGSFGGKGGTAKANSGSSYNYAPEIYEDPVATFVLGSGGGAGQGGSGGAGGGSIRIHVNETATINGTIRANGSNGANRRGAGSGGGILIYANTVAGSGSISAVGGNSSGDTNAYGGAGGGGRIYINYNSYTFSGTTSASAGTSYSGGNGEIGTVVLYDLVNEHIYTPSTQRWLAESATTFADLFPDATDMTITAGSLNLDSLNKTTVSSGIGWEIALDNLTIESGGTLSGNGLGYSGGNSGHNDGYGPGAGTSNGTGSENTGSGGSYGGKGGTAKANSGASYNYAPEVYADPADTFYLGSGGGAGQGGSGSGGGGAVKLTISGSLTVDGSISMNGANSAYRTGAGSGGGISINTNTVTGTGSVSANGGSAPSGDNNAYGGGGGGGRIYLGYNTNSYTGTITANNGTSANSGGNGESGTVIYYDKGTDELLVKNSQRWLPVNTSSFNTWFPSVTDLTVTNTSTLTLDSTDKTSASSGAGWVMNVSNLTVDTGSKISGDSKGYSGGTSGHLAGYGPGGGEGTTTTNDGGAGGGYGGAGGDSTLRTGGTAYGSSTSPVDLGSGGGRHGNGNGGAGGGAVKVVALDTITIDGTVSMNGQAQSTFRRSGGAGGSIWLESKTLTGSGCINADGGSVSTNDVNGWAGAGGGGRIKLQYETKSFTSCITANGGDGRGTSADGAAGSINEEGLPTLSNALQYKSDGTTLIVTDGVTAQTTVVLKVDMVDGDPSDTLTPEFEIQEVGTSFTNTATDTGSGVAYSGSTVTGEVTVTGLTIDTYYHWQVRVCDTNTNCTEWASYGGNLESESDFAVSGFCPAVDGGTNDDDSTVDGIITVNSNQTWNVLEASQGQMDCSGLDIIVKAGNTLTLNPWEDGDNDYTEDYIAYLVADNIEVESTAYISSDYLGYPGGNGTNSGSGHVNDGWGPGYGEGVSNSTKVGGAGGSFGGKGTYGYNTVALPTDIYDNPVDMYNMGSGGGMRSSWGPGGAGGGGFVLDVSDASGTVTVNGELTADGQISPGLISGGGSGGSIRIITSTFAGSGTITANGARGGVHSSNNYGGSAGGGRIQIEYDTTSFSGTVSSIGGTHAYRTGEDGSLVIKNNTSDTLYIDQDQRWVPDSSTAFATWFPAMSNMVVCSSTSSDAECLNGNNAILYLDGGNRETTSSGYGWTLDLATFILDSGSQVSGYGKGYAPVVGGTGWGPSPGGYYGSTGAYGTGGGGHGGYGGSGTESSGNIQVFNPIEPVDLGSAGGSTAARSGGYGGGAIKLVTSGTATIDGILRMDGQDDGYRQGGGAGGSIWLDVNTLAGSGEIQADGGNGGANNSTYHGGGGGGGRVYIKYNSTTYSGTYRANGGTAYVSSRYGEDGSVIVWNETSNTLFIQNDQTWIPEDGASFTTWFSGVTDMVVCSSSSVASECLTGTNNVLSLDSINKQDDSLYDELSDDGDPEIVLTSASATFTINDADDLSAYESTSGRALYRIELHDNANPDHKLIGYLGDNNFSSPSNTFDIYRDIERTTRGWQGDIYSFVYTNTSTFTYDISIIGIGWDIELTNLTLDTGSIMNASNYGYDGGAGSHYDGYGPGGGEGVTNTSGHGGAGGGYGGRAGTADGGHPGGEQYELPINPVELGSGGGRRNGYGDGGAGGGAIKLDISNGFVLEGTIQANGQSNSGSSVSGGGSGGSIWIQVGGTLSGAGSVNANGGAGGPNASETTGGSGGRIHVEFSTSTFTGDYSVSAGSSPNGSSSEVGSVVVQNLTTNELLINHTQRWEPEHYNSFESWFPSVTSVNICSSISVHADCDNGTDVTLNLDSINKTSTTTYDEAGDDANPSITLTSASASFVINDSDDLTIYEGESNNAIYYIEVHDNANPDHMIYGYLGNNTFSSPTNTFEIYRDVELTSRGWKGNISSFQELDSSVWTYDITNLAFGWEFLLTNFKIDTNSIVSANSYGYAGGTNTSIDGYGPGGGESLSDGGDNGGSGGGYGGRGGDGYGGNGGEQFEIPVEPKLAGSGGGSRGGGSYSPGGAGGGAIKIVTTNNATINGTLRSNGQKLAPIAGGGSGGSIWLQVSNIFGGNGTITANGGDGGNDAGNRPGAGGGGRIYIKYSSSSYGGTVTANGGQNPSSRKGEDGSIILVNSSANDLIVDGDQRWEAEDYDTFEKWFPTIDDVLICSASSSDVACDNGNDIGLQLDSINKDPISDYNETNDDADPSLVLTPASATLTINDSDDLSDYEGDAARGLYLIQLEDNESSTHELWGYLGANSFSSPNNVFEIYRDPELTVRGWKGNTDNFVNSTPSNWTYDITNLGIGWDIDVASLTLDSGSYISANSLGYLGGSYPTRGYGPGGGESESDGGNNAGTGGSYGGKGGSGSGGTALEQFEIPTDPLLLGSGGGARGTTTYAPGGKGGGSIHITTSGNLVNNGTIRADGQKSSPLSGGGSGGSIWLEVGGTFSGAGAISAVGGDGGTDASSRPGAGGGGRIHVEYASSTYSGTYSAIGGDYPSNRVGENGSLIVEYLTGNDLFINSNQRWIPESVDSFETWFPSVQDITLGSSAILQLDSLNKDSDDHAIGWNWDLATLTIGSGSEIRLDSLGYNGGQAGGGHVDGYGPGGGNGTTSSVGASGGSHGGKGADGSGTTARETYGNISNPITVGSGGGAAECAGQAPGRAGGGAIHITTSGTLTIDGEISANGQNATSGVSSLGCRSGGGAGGSIWLDVDTIAGTGNISLIGGTGGLNSDMGGAGGGGRLSVQYNTDSYTGLVDSYGGQSPSSRKGENGTSVFEDKVNQHLYVYTSQRWEPTSANEFENLFPNVIDMTISALYEYVETDDDGDPAATLTASSADFTINDADDLSAFETTSGSALYIVVVDDNEATNHRIWGFLGDNTFSTPSNTFLVYNHRDRSTQEWMGDTGSFVTSTPSNWTYHIYAWTNFQLDSGNKDQTSGGYGWALGLENFTLDPGQIINGNQLGYEEGVSGDVNGKGPGGGTGVTGSGQGGGGGGHGGAGASGTVGAGGSTNDSLTAPIEPGSGGGTGECAGLKVGEPGGGAIKIAAETLNIYGEFLFNGGNASSSTSAGCRSGGGAGGSIWLLANTLNGTADLYAQGGYGGYYDDRGGAGGGGRVAIKYCTNNWTGSTYVAGGTLPASRQGGAGTVDNNSSTLGYITNLGSGLDAYLASDWTTDLENASNTQYCLVEVGIADNDTGQRIAQFYLFFDGNLDQSAISADSTTYESIMYLSGGFDSLNGYTNTHPTFGLYTQKGDATQVGVCPNATTIGGVDENCSGLYYLDATDTNVEVVDISGTDYWYVTELTNGGIFSEILNTAPVASSVTIDSGATDVVLTEGTTTTVSCTGTVTDADGFGNILSVEAILYRTGVGSGAADNNNNHYTLTGDSECIPSNGSGTTEDYTCDFDVYFHAEATDASSPQPGDDWTCEMTPSDGAGAGTSDSDTIEMDTLLALNVTSSIAYGQIELGGDTGGTNQSTTLTNTGNDSIDVDVSGDDMCTDYPTCSGAVLGATYQEYAETTFTYGVGGIDLSTSAATLDLSMSKPTSSPSTSTDILYWGIGIPGAQTKGVYSGANTFTAVTDT